MNFKLSGLAGQGLLIAAALCGFSGLAAADVTVEEKSAFDLSFFKANGLSVDQYTSDKKRRDYQFRCEGFMSVFCGKNNSGEIVRLDKDMTYRLEPAKKRYHEEPFPTAAERQEWKKRLAETQEKMKQCAAQQPASKPAVDTSKCQMSPPKLDVKNLGADGQILGHDVHHSVLTMTQSCTDKTTGDVCDMQFGFDLWLTADQIAGLEDRAAFNKAYVAKLGLVGEDGVISQQQLQQALAPYAEQMKQLRAKAGDLKGLPLRTSFVLAMGGAHCAANKSRSDSAGSGGDSPSTGGGVPTSLSDVGTKILGGMFAKKKKADDAAAAAAETHKSEALAPGMVSVVKFSTETTAIRTDPVPASQFEIPADWTKVLPKEKGKPDEFECPKNGKGD